MLFGCWAIGDLMDSIGIYDFALCDIVGWWGFGSALVWHLFSSVAWIYTWMFGRYSLTLRNSLTQGSSICTMIHVIWLCLCV